MNSTSENLDLENDLPAYDFSVTYCNLQSRYHRFLETEKKTTSRQSPSENDLCQSASCGTNAVCEAKENETLCKCPNGYSGESTCRHPATEAMHNLHGMPGLLGGIPSIFC